MTEKEFTFFPDVSRVPTSAEDLSALIMRKPKRIGVYMHEYLRLGWRAEFYEALLLIEIAPDNMGEAVKNIAVATGMMMAMHGVTRKDGIDFGDQSMDLLIRAVNNYGLDEPLSDCDAVQVRDLSNAVFVKAQELVMLHAAKMS